MYRGSSHVPKLRMAEDSCQVSVDRSERRMSRFEDLEVFKLAYRVSLGLVI